MRRIVVLCALLSFPVIALANSNGGPIRRTGAPIDGGLDCSQCHTGTPVNQGPGRVLVRANAYIPGVKQNITVEITDPTALRWSYQITSRLASDETRQAGSFTPNDSNRVMCDPAGDAPCNGAVEFAGLFASATRIATGGPQQTFVLDWTPPGRDVGQIVFYAAALAANNDNTVNGDRTYTTSTRVSSAGCQFKDSPTLAPMNAVVNAASFQTGVSPNSLITIFGNGFSFAGDKYKATRGDLVGGRLPLDLACLAVEIGGQRVPVYYTETGQINAQMPQVSTTGSLSTVVILNPGGPNEMRSGSAAAQNVAFAPAFFTFDGKSIAALNASNGYRILVDPAVISGGVFARPGDIVALYGTGFGPTNPQYDTGFFAAGLAPTTQAATVTIGGTTLSPQDVLYVGLSPDAPGLYQLNVRVPQSASDGNVPVSVHIGTGTTPTGVTIPVKR